MKCQNTEGKLNINQSNFILLEKMMFIFIKRRDLTTLCVSGWQSHSWCQHLHISSERFLVKIQWLMAPCFRNILLQRTLPCPGIFQRTLNILQTCRSRQQCPPVDQCHMTLSQCERTLNYLFCYFLRDHLLSGLA